MSDNPTPTITCNQFIKFDGPKKIGNDSVIILTLENVPAGVQAAIMASLTYMVELANAGEL